MRRYTIMLGSAALAAAVSAATPVWAGVTIAAHRAVYDLELKEASDRSGIAGVTGRMVIELTGSQCEGWTINFRMINQYLLQRGMTRLADNRSSSWEAGDGLSMHFTQRQFVDNKLQEESRLKVGRERLGEAGEGVMSKPKAETFQIASEAVFPVQHQVRLVEAALAGEPRDRSLVYDGSEGAKAYVAVAFIGPEASGDKQAGKGADALHDKRAWPVSISYFDQTTERAGEATPAYQVSFRMFENGVAGDLTLDYGDFVLKGSLTDYEALKQTACD